MSFVQELKSGKLTIYAQWIAFLAVIVIFVNAIQAIWTMIPLSILGWFLSVVLALIEFPFMQRCFKKGFIALNTYAGNINSCKTRAMIYGLASIAIGITYVFTTAASSFTGSLVLLLVNFLLYVVAIVRGEPLFRSFIFGSGNIDEENPPQIPAPDI